MRRRPTSPTDHDPDERLTFTDVTVLAFLAVSGAALAAVVLLGTLSTLHRTTAVLGGL